MGASGTTTVDFGAFPGGTSTSVAVTGQAGIVSGSLVEAWIRPVATSDHSADEHLVDPPRLLAGNISAGTGFTVYAMSPDNPGYGPLRDGMRLYGQYTVAWVWS